MSKKTIILLTVLNAAIIFNAVLLVSGLTNESNRMDVELWAEENGIYLDYGYSEKVENLPIFLKNIYVKFVTKEVTSISFDMTMFPSHLDDKALNFEQLLDDPSPEMDLTPIANLKDLEYLYISGARLKNCAALSKIHQLKSVTLGGTYLDNVNFLQSHKKLKEVFLLGTSLKDISGLQNASYLKSLLLVSTSVKELRVLKNLSNLKNLGLINNTGDIDIKDLLVLKNLEGLSLQGTVSKNLLELQKLSRLKQLSLTAELVSLDDFKKLQKALPNCQIDYESENLPEE